jgi:two-component system, OmpR family, sensor kinase
VVRRSRDRRPARAAHWLRDMPKSFWVRIYERKRLRRRIFVWIALAMLLSAAFIHLGAQWYTLNWKHSVLIVVVTTWFAAGAIASRIAHPFDQIARVADALGKGDLAARTNVAGLPRGEPRVLGQVLNEMAARLEGQVNEQRALLAMVSHEVRTPLSRMQLLLEGLQVEDAEKREQARHGLEREIFEMDDLIGQLLATTRIELNRQERKEIDAVSIALRALEAARVAPECLDADENLGAFSGDATLVLRALVNLLQNAKNHANGVESFCIRREGDTLSFEVNDRGPGIPPLDLERIFEPFVHGTASATHTRSVGLGLSLVRRIAEAHKGKVFAENRADGGARFVLVLPGSLS